MTTLTSAPKYRKLALLTTLLTVICGISSVAQQPAAKAPRVGAILTDSKNGLAPAHPRQNYTVPPPQGSGDWPQYLYDSSHDGNNTGENILNKANVVNLQEKWTATVCKPKEKCNNTSQFYSSPITSDGNVYVGSLDGNLYGFSADGKTLDYFPVWLGPKPISGSPAAGTSLIYVSSQGTDTNLYAVDPTAGKVKWSQSSGYGNGFFLSPIVTNTYVTGPQVVAQDSTGTLFGFDPDSGNVSYYANGWLIQSSPGYTTPSYTATISEDAQFDQDWTLECCGYWFSMPDAGGAAWHGMAAGNLSLNGTFARDLGSGCSTPNCSALATAGVANFTVSGQSDLVAFAGDQVAGGGVWAASKSENIIAWNDPAPNGTVTAAPAVDPANNIVYVIVDFKTGGWVSFSESDLFALDATDGHIVFQKQLSGSHLYASPVLANGVVYTATRTWIEAWDAGTGDKLWRSNRLNPDSTLASLIVSHGQVYVVTHEGILHAYGLP